MDNLKITPSKASKYGVNIAKDGISRSANQILGQKSVNMRKIRKIWPEIQYISREIDEQLDRVRDASSDRYEMIKSIYYQNRNAQLEEEYIQNLPVPKIYIE